MPERKKPAAGPKIRKCITLSTPKIPPEITKHIKGRLVDISRAHQYYPKLWDAVRPRLGALVSDLGQGRYELGAPFFQYLLERLPNFLRSARYPDSQRNAADFLAWGLFDAAWTYGIPPRELSATRPIPLWPRDRPVSEAWRMLGTTHVNPHGLKVVMVFEDPGAGEKLQVTNAARYTYPRIGVTTTFSQDRRTLPRITIELEGELVCVLMMARRHSKDAKERRKRRAEANRIWETLFKELRILFEIEQPREGRPSEFDFEEAAYLKYQAGLSRLQVTKRLCLEKHPHSEECRERLRKGVDYFFNQIRHRARLLPPVS